MPPSPANSKPCAGRRASRGDRPNLKARRVLSSAKGLIADRFAPAIVDVDAGQDGEEVGKWFVSSMQLTAGPLQLPCRSLGQLWSFNDPARPQPQVWAPESKFHNS